jgi:GNAT superfamily N-acetyltransferase
VRLVRCQPAQRSRLHALWRATMPAEVLPETRFDEILSVTGFEGAMLLYRQDQAIGFVHCAARPKPGAAHGWILGFGLLEAERGRGLGRLLIERAVHHLDSAGCGVVAIGGPGEAYLLPGLDIDLYPSAAASLSASGFTGTGETVGMQAVLSERLLPPTSGGADLRVPDPSERTAVMLMIRTRFSESWADLVEDKATNDRLLAAFAEGQPVGFAAHDLFAGCPGRFGPMGVVDEARGRGLGSQLLRASLEAMRAQGTERAWFLWGPESSAGQAMYRHAGFQVWRRFAFFERELTPGSPMIAAIA